MTVAPTETWPSAAITTESPRRTQITVVERTRRPSARSMGWASPGKVVEAAFTTTGDFVEREKDGFMGNLQYIADCPLIRLSAFALHSPRVSIYGHLAFSRIRESKKRNACRRKQRQGPKFRNLNPRRSVHWPPHRFL